MVWFQTLSLCIELKDRHVSFFSLYPMARIEFQDLDFSMFSRCAQFVVGFKREIVEQDFEFPGNRKLVGGGKSVLQQY
jgi:hypothetical protein